MHEFAKTAILLAARSHRRDSTRGRPRCDDAILLKYILVMLQTGMQWRGLADTNCPYHFSTVHHCFMRWSSHGVLQTAYARVLKLYLRKKRPNFFCMDTTFVKNVYGADCIGRNPTDRGRMATKISTINDDTGVLHSMCAFPANCSDFGTVTKTLHSCLTKPSRQPIYCDKGYDSKATRKQLQAHGYIDRVGKRGVRVHRVVNRKRGVVERFYSWMDKNRRLILRYDKFTHIYL